MIILGIDPGTYYTGFGLIEKNGKNWAHVDNGLIAPPAKLSLPEKLEQIFNGLRQMIERHQPKEIALEDIFFAKNAKSALKLGHARGVAMLAAAHHQIPVFEYPPARIKQAITGFGQATKEQMQKMVKIHLKLKEVAEENANDALAVALCHCQTKRFQK